MVFNQTFEAFIENIIGTIPYGLRDYVYLLEYAIVLFLIANLFMVFRSIIHR